MLVKDGTLSLGGPSETATVTVDPSFRLVDGLGFWDTMAPDPTVMDLTGAPSARCMCTLSRVVLPWDTVIPARFGVGCDGVNTFVSKAAARPPATRSNTTTRAVISHPRWRRQNDRRTFITAGPSGSPRAADVAPLAGSASKISPGPALVPIGAALSLVVPVTAAAAPPPATAVSVSSLMPGAWNAAIGAESSRCGITSGSGAGVGNAAANAPSRAARPAASRRAATSGAAARASTSSRGPNAGSCGNGWPIRAASVPIVVSVTNGTVPVNAPYKPDALAYTSARPSTGFPSAASGEMYRAVPTMAPAGSVHAASASARATPKSATRTRPSSSNNRFAG